MIGTSALPPIRWKSAIVLAVLALSCLVPFNFMPGAWLPVGSWPVPLHFIIFFAAGAFMLSVALYRAVRSQNLPPFVSWSLVVTIGLAAASAASDAPRDGWTATAGFLFRCVSLGWFAWLAVVDEGDDTLRVGLAILGAVVAIGAVYEPLSGHFFLFSRAQPPNEPPSELWDPLRRVAVGAIGQPLPLAALLNLFLPFSLWNWGKSRRALWLVASIAILIGIFMTFRRSGYAIAALTVAAFLWSFRADRVLIGSAVFAVVACLVAVVALPSARGMILARFNARHTAVEIVSSHRTQVYGTVLEMAKLHPWLGIGPRRYEKRYLEFAHYTNPIETPDNQYLRFLAEGGLIGFVSFVGFVVALLRTLYFRRRGGEPYLLAALGFCLALVLLDGLYWPAAGMTFFAVAGAGAARPAA